MSQLPLLLPEFFLSLLQQIFHCAIQTQLHTTPAQHLAIDVHFSCSFLVFVVRDKADAVLLLAPNLAGRCYVVAARTASNGSAVHELRVRCVHTRVNLCDDIINGNDTLTQNERLEVEVDFETVFVRWRRHF
jgi:hypothetical protein